MTRRILVVGAHAAAVMALLLASGCATDQPIVKVEHVLVAPSDDMLLDCEVTAPPRQEDYLTHAIDMNAFAGSAPHYDLSADPAQGYLKIIKRMQTREQMQTKLNLAQLSNLDRCNKRLKALREWKTKAVKEIANPDIKGK